MANFTFPTNAEEAREWKPTTMRYALHSKVLTHARTHVEGKWAAYCFPVPGENHEREEGLWREIGVKLSEEVAVALFPYFAELPYAR